MKLTYFFIFFCWGTFPFNVSAFQAEAFKSLQDDYNKKWSTEKHGTEELWDQHKKEIKKKWNEIKLPSVKTFVSYYDEYDSRIEIDFERGIVNFETLSPDLLSKQELNKIFSRGLKNSESLLFNQIDSKSLSDGLDHLFKPSDEIQASDGVTRKHYKSKVLLVSDHVKRRAHAYIPLVKSIAENHSLPVELIMAVMWQESAFNPMARSHIPAYGLMQIVPRFAGIEVRDHLGETQTVDGEFLYIPANNIRYGIIYLSLLSTKYFSHINPFGKRAPFIIAGYNWGPTRLLKHLKNGKISLNDPFEIKSQIQVLAPNETKDYLEKVTEKWSKISAEKWI